MRKNIACLAARLMAEDGVSDYGLAKRKAARQLGAAETEALPNNAEIEDELRAYQALYQGDEQRERLTDLRRTALKAMDYLGEFRPYLTGPVLDGTAGRFAGIELEIFTEDTKAVELFLLNRGVEYRPETPHQLVSSEAPETMLHFHLDDTPISLALYSSVAERNRRRHRDGRIINRARADAVLSLRQEKSAP
jgi:hypothetical protein